MISLRIGILIFDGVEELDFVGPWEVFSYVNKVQAHPTRMLLVAPSAPVQAYNGLRVLPDCTLGDCPRLDTLIVPGGKGRLQAMHDPMILDFLRERYEGLQFLGSVCTGALILAEAGLLDGRCATTHHTALDELGGYPSITVRPDRVVRDGNVLSAAGVTAGIDLAFQLVEELFGTDVALAVDRGIEFDRYTKT